MYRNGSLPVTDKANNYKLLEKVYSARLCIKQALQDLFLSWNVNEMRSFFISYDISKISFSINAAEIASKSVYDFCEDFNMHKLKGISPTPRRGSALWVNKLWN